MSSRNATKHGLWAREVAPITRGPFKENAEEFHQRVEEVIADLNPRGTAQMMAAKRAAAALMRLERTDRAEAALLLEANHLENLERQVYPDPDKLLDAVLEVEALLDYLAFISGEVVELEDPPQWGYLAIYLRKHSPDPNVGVKDIWTDEAIPQSEEDWKRAARALYRHHWKSNEACFLYLLHRKDDLERAAERATERHDGLMAKRMLDVTSNHIDRPRTAAWTEFKRSYDLLRRLQADDPVAAEDEPDEDS